MRGSCREIQDYLVKDTLRTGPCEGFREPCVNTGTWRRQNTAYSNDLENFRCYCPSCQEDADAYWKEAWDGYYSTRF
jgi:hypothetical protein